MKNGNSNGPNLNARHRATYIRLLDLPRHRWEPSRATPWPLSYIPRHCKFVASRMSHDIHGMVAELPGAEEAS